ICKRWDGVVGHVVAVRVLPMYLSTFQTIHHKQECCRGTEPGRGSESTRTHTQRRLGEMIERENDEFDFVGEPFTARGAEGRLSSRSSCHCCRSGSEWIQQQPIASAHGSFGVRQRRSRQFLTSEWR
ncbi:unnamed protein product, partial [Ectocarpus sp. 13 AM-2016]